MTQVLLKGYSRTQTARLLNISPHTVQDHLKTIFDKVGVHSQHELLTRLLGHGRNDVDDRDNAPALSCWPGKPFREM